MDKRPFDGLKVIDFTWGGVGGFHCNYLAYYGATVVRVESATRPDITRTTGAQFNMRKEGDIGLDSSPAFAVTHPVKKYGIRLNVKVPKAIDIFKRLVVWSDVFVESFTAGTMEGFGLGYAELKKLKPDIIMYRTNGLGHTGPMAAQPGLGQTWTALTGFHGITGWPDRASVPVSSFYTDHLAPPFGGLALIAAIDYRRRTGKGQCIDQAQVETGLNYMGPVLLDYTVNGRELALTGNKCDYAAPHGAYPCRGNDRWVAIGVYNDDEWEAFCYVIGDPQWTTEERFSTLGERVKNSAELDRLVGEWTINFTAEQVMAMLQAEGVCAGVVATAQDSEEDPQLKQYDFFHYIDHPYMGNYNFYHPAPFKLSGATAERARPTLIGEETERVCKEMLGMKAEEYNQLSKEGVFN
jgi:benzylsuccinate CoA-transferase BbsF subunit